MEAEKGMKWWTNWKRILGGQGIGFNIIFGICLFLLVVANLLFPAIERNYALRTDFTENQLYTLSDKTQEILRGLKEDIYIYAVYSPGNEDTRVQALLEEYGAASPYIHVASVSTEVLQMTEVKMQSVMQEGVVFFNADRSFSHSFPYENLYMTDENGNQIGWKAEAKITAAIQGIVRGAFCNVRLLTGHGETTEKDLNGFLQLLDIGNFQVDSYDPSADTQSLDASTDVLVIVSPKADLEHSEYEAISQFMKEGGRILLLLDRSSFNTTQGILQIYTTELPLFSQLLADYNIQINDDLIFSRSVEAINLRRTSFRATPLMHSVTEQLMAEGQGVVVNEAASLRFLKGGEVKISALLAADAHCFAKTLENGVENFTYQEKDAQGTFIVAAIAEKDTSRLAVVTDSLCIGDESLSIPGNRLFFENLVNTLSPMEPLVSIESKTMYIPGIPSSGGTAQMLLIIGGLLVLPFAVLYIGIQMKAGKWRK
jgi:ABC-2 type transport system permease protein